MNNSSYTDIELLSYLDGELDSIQKQKLEEVLAISPMLKKRLNELRIVHSLLAKKNSLEIPSRNFTHKVMDGLDAAPSKSTVSYRNGILLLIGSILASAIALMLLTSGVFDSSTSLEIDAPLKNKLIPEITFSIPFNSKMIVSGILFLNLALVLVLLDRTVLKPLFQKRSFV